MVLIVSNDAKMINNSQLEVFNFLKKLIQFFKEATNLLNNYTILPV